MKKFCELDGHTYIHTSEGKSSRCATPGCGKLRMPWHKESIASLRAAAVLRITLRKGWT